MFVRASLYKRRKENQLVATKWFCTYNLLDMFRALICPSSGACDYGLLLPNMVCNALVAGGRRSGAGQQAMRPG